MRYSIIVPVHNGGELLRKCLESLTRLDLSGIDAEILVVDNKSSDDTAEIIRSFPVTYLSETRHQGSYAARNRGLVAAKGELMAFTDADCEVDPLWLQAIERETRDASIGCFAGEILSYPPNSIVERYSDRIGLLRQRGPLSGWHFKPYAQTANAVYRREVFDAIGMFDPAMKSGGDAAIAWRMLDKTDFAIKFVEDAVVYHHHRTDVAGLWAQFRRYGGGKNSWALDRQDYRPPSMESLESEAIATVAAHIDALARNGADEERDIFPLLKMTTQFAHLHGYAMDLLKLMAAGAPSESAADLARAAAPLCAICAGRAFAPGPNGRLERGRAPQCCGCQSLERHRALSVVLKTLPSAMPEARCLSVGEALHPRLRMFAAHDVASSPETPPPGLFDVVVASGLFTSAALRPVGRTLQHLVPTLSDEAILVMADSARGATSRTAFDEHGAVRAMGADFPTIIAASLPNTAVCAAYIADQPTGTTTQVVLASGNRALMDTVTSSAAPACVRVVPISL